MPYFELVRLIRGAGKRPVERDSLYQPVRESFDDPPPEPSLVARGASCCRWCTPHERFGSAYPWINCYPVYGAIDRGLVPVPAELVTGTASELERPARRRRAGRERRCPRSNTPGTRPPIICCPICAITCDGPVHSVAAVLPPAGEQNCDGATVLLSASSRTSSVLLLELLCRHR